jgi:hypothetical protein
MLIGARRLVLCGEGRSMKRSRTGTKNWTCRGEGGDAGDGEADGTCDKLLGGYRKFVGYCE